MIKIDRDFKSLAKEHSDKIIKTLNIVDLLDNEIKNDNSRKDNFLKFLKVNISDVLSLDPVSLERKIISKANTILDEDFFLETIPNKGIPGPKPRKNKDFIEILKSVFDYDKFISNQTYSAYDLTEKLNIKVCPYCNRNYISTLKPQKKKQKTIESGTRPTLDHFYLKSDYPYLALSFWNLIPSCYSCNTQFRSTKPFSIFNNTHPYINCFENALHFQTDVSDVTDFIGNSKINFNIELKEKYKNITKTSRFKRALKNKNVFRLDDLYNQNHKEDIRELIQKAIIYNESYSKALHSEFPDIFLNDYDAQKMVLGNYTNPDDFEKRPLAKLTRDIADELGLI